MAGSGETGPSLKIGGSGADTSDIAQMEPPMWNAETPPKHDRRQQAQNEAPVAAGHWIALLNKYSSRSTK